MIARPTLVIDELIRSPQRGPEDHLTFSKGVNVLVGRPNTGKTKWLQMLNYLMTSEDDPAEVFGDVVATKYTSVTARLTVSGLSLDVERRWADNSPKNRVLVNGETTTVKDFLLMLMERLEIPVLHYPQGNPYGQRSWPELGWKSLFRHVYRRQMLWGDIADRQPESEQLACILQFTGLAEHLYSAEYGSLVGSQKRILELQAQKESFVSTLSQVTKDILYAEELGVGLTPQSLDTARNRLRSEMGRLQEDRTELLAELTERVATSGVEGRNRIDELSQELASLKNREAELLDAVERNRSRLEEMASYRSDVEQEVARLERAQTAGSILADLKVTHCPACDQPVSSKPNDETCYLCHRPMSKSPTPTSVERLELEISQARAVLAEASEMVSMIERDQKRLDDDLGKTRAEIVEVRGMLRPVRSAAAAVMPPEIAVLDMQMGRLQEKAAQIERVSKSLAYRDVLTSEIERIQSASASLEEEVARQSAALEFERASDQLQDGMNTYLNAIKQLVPSAWTQNEARVRVGEKKVRFLVGNRLWSAQLGGTLSLYYLIAYHYALMTLMKCERCHFPGLLILDFPAELDGPSIRDEENFAVEPFVSLLCGEGFEDCQIIAAGAAFEGLEGANRIEFHTVWE